MGSVNERNYVGQFLESEICLQQPACGLPLSYLSRVSFASFGLIWEIRNG
jgi:hypothetical protein